MRVPRLLALVVPLILLTLLAGCGGDDDDDSNETATPQTSDTPAASATEDGATRTSVPAGSPTEEETAAEETSTEESPTEASSPTTSETEDAATAEETSTASGDSELTIVADDLEFDTTEFEAPPDTEITIVLDNQEDGMLHNIAFWDGPEAGEGELLTGCTSGCEGDEVRTELVPGPAEDRITFTTPSEEGEYAFWCEVHPTTMVGTMTISADAEAPSD